MTDLSSNTTKSTPNINLPINIAEIMLYMPHRYPLLLVDRVIDLSVGVSIKTLKNVTINENFFAGHFPNYPVMPGVLIIESMAQSAGILAILTDGVIAVNELYFFAAINKAKFKQQVIPGDTIIFEIKIVKSLMGISIYQAEAYVANKIVASAEITVARKKIKET